MKSNWLVGDLAPAPLRRDTRHPIRRWASNVSLAITVGVVAVILLLKAVGQLP